MSIPIHWGERIIDDTKVINTVTLGALEPDIFPQVIITNNSEQRSTDYFPMNSLPGKDWRELYGQLTAEENLIILKETVRQIELVYKKYGILLRDRHPGNIRVHVNDNYRVWQMDLEDVYDAVTDQMFLPTLPEIRSRGNIVPLSQRGATYLLSSILSGLVHSLSVAFRFTETSAKLKSTLSKILAEIEWDQKRNFPEKVNFEQVNTWIDLLLEAAK